MPQEGRYPFCHPGQFRGFPGPSEPLHLNGEERERLRVERRKRIVPLDRYAVLQELSHHPPRRGTVSGDKAGAHVVPGRAARTACRRLLIPLHDTEPELGG